MNAATATVAKATCASLGGEEAAVSHPRLHSGRLQHGGGEIDQR